MAFNPDKTDTDIVERLRASAATWVEQGGYSPNLHEDAADEIERLRAGLRGAATVVRASADEIERLRAALVQIIEYDGRHYANDGNARIVNTARAALGKAKK